jgi:hypothetical protein
MAETDILSTHELNTDNPVVTTEFLPAIGLDLAAELNRADDWGKTGECAGPTPIAKLTLQSDVLAELQSTSSEKYLRYVSYEKQGLPKLTLDDDPDTYLESKNQELRNAIMAAFTAVIERDIENSGNSLEIWLPAMNIGMFGQTMADIHIDRFDERQVRYIVALAGPTTRFFMGNFSKQAFNNGGELSADIPKSAQSTPIPLGVVMRFMSNADPHSTPEVDEPVFRILCDSTVMPKEHVSF